MCIFICQAAFVALCRGKSPLLSHSRVVFRFHVVVVVVPLRVHLVCVCLSKPDSSAIPNSARSLFSRENCRAFFHLSLYVHRVCACTWTRAVLNVGLDTQSEKEERTRATRSASKREDSVLRPRGGMTFVAVSRERERGDGRAGMSKYAM